MAKESEQATPVVSIKDVVRSSVKVPEFDKHLKKAGGHIDRNVVEITIKMKTIVFSDYCLNDKNQQASSQKQTVLAVAKSLYGFVSNQVQYNMENTQYIGQSYYIIIIIIIIIINKYILDIYI